MKDSHSEQFARRMEGLLKDAGLNKCEVSAEWVLNVRTRGHNLTEEERYKVYEIEWLLLTEFDIPISLYLEDTAKS